MKKNSLLFLFFLIVHQNIFAQNIYFNKRIDVTGYAEVCRSIVLTKGGYLVAGGHGETSTFIYLSNIDSVGNLKWTKDFGVAGYNYYLGLSGALFKSFDKHYMICGSRVPQPKGYSILIKVDSLGNKKWEKEYLFSDNSNKANSGNITRDSGFILTGDAYISGPKYCYLLLKTDSLGNQQWYKTFTDNHAYRNYQGTSVIQTADNGYCLGCYGIYYQFGLYKGIAEIIKTDEFGNQQWKKTYGDPLNCNVGCMLCLSNDNCIIGAYSLCNSGSAYVDRQIYLTKISMGGTEIWNKKIGKALPSKTAYWIQTLDDGNFILCGSNRVKDTLGKCVGWIFKLNANGDSIWYREYAVITGPHDANELWQVTPTPDGGFAGAGNLFPTEAGGGQDIWVFKTDRMGCLVPNCDGVGITEFNPNAGAQMLVYPNPFTNAFAINYNIPKENKKGVFELRDVLGHLVYSTPLTINVNQLQVVASSLKAGIYIASLVMDGVVVQSVKLIKE
jgi:hypothetical protein